VAEFNLKARKNVRHIPDSVWAALQVHDWPGNVRELRNVVERCVLFSEGETFPEQWLQLPGAAAGAARAEARREGDVLSLPLDGSVSLEEMERQIIRAMLEQTQNNTTAAARLLGTTRQTLRYRIQKYGLAAGDEGD
jgi:DNA-binding NtrC family response regulator